MTTDLAFFLIHTLFAQILESFSFGGFGGWHSPVILLQLMVDEKFEDADIEPAPKLIEAVLQNCRGRVDQWLEPYLRISIERLRKTRKNYLKDLLVNVVANGLYYNASMTLTILQHLGVTSEFFQTWFRMLYEVKKSGKPLHFVRYWFILTNVMFCSETGVQF